MKIKVYVECKGPQSKIIELPDVMWNSMKDAQKQDELTLQAEMYLETVVKYGAEVVE